MGASVTPTRNRTDDQSLVCDACGYLLENLAISGVCPECGLAIRESAAGTRRGSAWQRRPGISSWVRTGGAVLFRPRRLFRGIDIGDHRGRSLLVVNLAVAGAIVAAAPSLRVLMGRDAVVPWVARGGVFRGEQWMWVLALVALGVVGATFFVLLLMTWTEVAGSRFVGARRGVCVSRGVAWSVCAHASYGWIVAAFLLAAGWSLIDLDYAIARRALTTTVRSRVGDWMLLPPLLGFFAGMMLFEYRVYQGLRACGVPTTPEGEPGA